MEVVGPKWEDLNVDCLVNILARVGMESLLLDVPYVCKSWYKATCNPQSWSILDFEGCFFEEIPCRLKQKYQLYRVSSCDEFIKYVAKRGNKFVTHMKLPECCLPDNLDIISDECPNLKTLKLTADRKLPLFLGCRIPIAVGKWKRLENLSFHCSYSNQNIFIQISIHCKDIATLEIFEGEISEDDVSALVSLPNLKSLSIRSADVSKEHLLMILKGCKRLEYLDVRGCVGFDEDDAEILGSAAHILSVQLEGSRLCEYVDIEDDDSEDYSDHDDEDYSDENYDYGDYYYSASD